jgi:hypothetical protein
MKTNLPAGNQEIRDILDAFCRRNTHNEGNDNVGNSDDPIPEGEPHICFRDRRVKGSDESVRPGILFRERNLCLLLN